MWRNVHISPQFDERLDYYFGGDSGGSSFVTELLNHEIIPHVFQAFKEDWDQLRFVNPDETSPRERYYDYRSDLAVADMIIYGRLDSVTIYDNYIEENITLFYLMVRRDEIPLEHPEDPTPDR